MILGGLAIALAGALYGLKFELDHKNTDVYV